jgi:hypothetical protein
LDPRAYLTELGYSAEDIAGMLGDEKQAKLIAHAAKSYSEGKSLREQAAVEKAETASFWEQKTQELQGSVTRLTAAEKRAATAEAAAAQRTAYLKSLKDQGYDVPDEMIGSATAHTPEPPKYMTQADVERSMRSTAPDLVSLTALSNEYYSLFGAPYIAVEEDFRAAQQAGKPLREFARSKYNFDGKKQELATKADQARIDVIVAEQMKTKEAELAAKYGSNPDLRTPVPSKFDKLSKREGFKSDSWKSPEGRNANREERLKRVENATLQ